MTFEGALIREQGVNFAIVIVKQHVISNRLTAKKAISGFQSAFPGQPIVLMAQDSRGTPTYFGRHDIVNFLKQTPLQCIPWKKFTV